MSLEYNEPVQLSEHKRRLICQRDNFFLIHALSSNAESVSLIIQVV